MTLKFKWIFPMRMLLLLLFLFSSFSFSHLTSSQEENEPVKKIALIFLTRNGVNHPNLWKALINSCREKVNFYIYSDQPLADPFFEKHRIKKRIPTAWDYHIKTWQLILTEAVKDPENYKFVYLSESCIPLFPLEDIHKKLTDNNVSYMCFAGPWWPREGGREVTDLPIEHRWGNHEWVILNRKHAEMIVQDDQVIPIVSRFWIDSESYPSSLFSVKGCLHEFYCRPSTYVNWALPEGGGAHPYHFREDSLFNREMLLKAKQEGHFFARKFTPSFPEGTLYQMIITNP